MLHEKKENTAKYPFVDISIPITSGMINWPGNPPVDISLIRDQSKGDGSVADLIRRWQPYQLLL